MDELNKDQLSELEALSDMVDLMLKYKVEAEQTRKRGKCRTPIQMT
jgi:hypothetical protein